MSRRHWLLMALIPILMMTLVSCGDQPLDSSTPSSDGIDIHFTATGSGQPALVFVHGWSCDAGYWEAQVDHFSPTNRVVCIDLGGHGQSGQNREDWTMQAFGQDVKAVVTALDLDEVVLIGHSMGGAVIAEAAMLMPDRVIGLVGVDNFQALKLGLTDEQIQGFLTYFSNDFSKNVKGWVEQMFPAGVDSLLVERISTDMAAAPQEIALGAMDNLLRWYDQRTVAVLPELPAPLHCINSDSAPTDEAGIKELRPDYKLRLIPGGSHFLAQERPETFNSLLTESLVELTGSR
jgi:pimeloyl-ACP methyl ester carboxylesterase